MKHNHDRTEHSTTAVKNPNWPEANQLAIYKCSREVEPGTTRNKFNEWSNRVSNPRSPDLKASALTTGPPASPPPPPKQNQLATMGFEPMISAMQVQCSTNWAMTSLSWEQVNLLGSCVPTVKVLISEWKNLKWGSQTKGKSNHRTIRDSCLNCLPFVMINNCIYPSQKVTLTLSL